MYAEYFESTDGKEIPLGTSVVLEGDRIRPANGGEVPIGVTCTNPTVVEGAYIEWPKKFLKDELGNFIMEEYREERTKPKQEKVIRERQKVEVKTIEAEETRTETVFEDGKHLQKEITEPVTREVEEPIFEEVDLYDASGENVIGKHQIPVTETYEEEMDVVDESGQPVVVPSGEFIIRQHQKLNPEHDESHEYIPREQRPEWNCVGLIGKLPLRKGQPVAEGWVRLKDTSEGIELWLVI